MSATGVSGAVAACSSSVARHRRNRSAHGRSKRSVLYSIVSVEIMPSGLSADTDRSNFAVPVSTTSVARANAGKVKRGGVRIP